MWPGALRGLVIGCLCRVGGTGSGGISPFAGRGGMPDQSTCWKSAASGTGSGGGGGRVVVYWGLRGD